MSEDVRLSTNGDDCDWDHAFRKVFRSIENAAELQHISVDEAWRLARDAYFAKKSRSRGGLRRGAGRPARDIHAVTGVPIDLLPLRAIIQKSLMVTKLNPALSGRDVDGWRKAVNDISMRDAIANVVATKRVSEIVQKGREPIEPKVFAQRVSSLAAENETMSVARSLQQAIIKSSAAAKKQAAILRAQRHASRCRKKLKASPRAQLGSEPA